tara:strand:+ start:381 stop:650 length:270 start_codon:yes stop_codon:yes gene_type:complete
MSIEELIKAVGDKQFSAAETGFSTIMMQKMSDAMDQEKIKLADQIFNGAEPEEEEDIEDIDDEESSEDEEEQAETEDEVEDNETEDEEV